MNAPQISPYLFFICEMVDQAADRIADPNLKLIVKTAASLGKAVTIYLIARGVILGLKR